MSIFGTLSDLFSGSSSSNKSTTPTTTAAATPFVDPTLPGRIPVSTGMPSLAGSITAKPAGVSSADWQKYQNLSGKLTDPNNGTISSKNQKWYDAFVAKYGVAPMPVPNPGTGGGGTNGLPTSPPGVLPDVGLLTRPYSNPFEQRNLWNLFPDQAPLTGNTSGGVRG